MKLLFVAFALLGAFATATLAQVNTEYLPPVQEHVEVAEIAENIQPEIEPAHELADDGYRYKTVKRYRFRHRRDVSELPSSEYLPPVQQTVEVAEAPAQEYIAPVEEAAPAHQLADDGYRYKTVKRYRFRHRRDVSELPSTEYLPPVQEQVSVAETPNTEYLPPVSEAAPAHQLADDGYRYKTVKRYRFRHRRDVSELPSTEYLPPVQQSVEVAEAPAQEYIAPVEEAAPAHQLADDGYRYKTVKRYRFRHRRDVSELPSTEYLPPVQEQVSVAETPNTEYLPPVAEAAPAHQLADDGYRYKTVKRYRFRHRRDVSELPSTEYLPPVQQSVEVAEAPAQEYIAPVEEAAPAHQLADDGYRYKTVKRYRFRHRRDVSELPSSEYLPPVQQSVEIAEAPAQEYIAPVEEAAPAHQLADDGYRYKTVKRYRYRHRRDVSELPSTQYLPPAQEQVEIAVAPAPEYIAPEPVQEPEPAHQLADDGYRYKTVKRYRFRHRRDVSELPSSEYLPPVQQTIEVAETPNTEYLPPVSEAAPAHELSNDGYRYKTVKRYRYRHRV